MMKYLLQTLAALTLCMITAQWAQAQIIYNPQAGIVVTHYSDEPPQFDIDAGVGIQIGAYARVRLTDNVFLQPGLFVQQTKADFAGEFNSTQSDEEIKTTSLKVPLYLGFYLGDAGPLRLRAAGGFAGKYMTGVKDNEFNLDSDEFRNLNWSLNIGAGVDLFLLTLDIEYDLGLSPTFETISDGKTNLLVVSAGLKF
jgi:hypothetical protein